MVTILKIRKRKNGFSLNSNEDIKRKESKRIFLSIIVQDEDRDSDPTPPRPLSVSAALLLQTDANVKNLTEEKNGSFCSPVVSQYWYLPNSSL
jgi:hypothetical protein